MLGDANIAIDSSVKWKYGDPKRIISDKLVKMRVFSRANERDQWSKPILTDGYAGFVVRKFRNPNGKKQADIFVIDDVFDATIRSAAVPDIDLPVPLPRPVQPQPKVGRSGDQSMK